MPIEGILGGISSVIGIAGGVKDLFRSEPDQQFATRPPFRGTITTPAFRFAGGTLSRTGTDAFSAAGFANSLSGVRSGLAGLSSRVTSLRPQISAGLRGAQGLFGGTNALRGDIAGLDRGLSGLQEQVRPGFGRLTESAITTIRNQASQASGNLRQQLSQRKLLGSSFANAQQASISRDFAELEEQTRSQAIVQEIETTRQIVKDRAGLVELSGRLLELDQRSLIEQARFIALDLQATEQEADLFAQQVSVIQTEMQAFRDQVNRELAELSLSTSFLAVVDQIIGDQATSQVQQATSSIGSKTIFTEGGGDGGGDGGDGGGDGGGACFAAGTMVEMADGREKPIEEIEIGDLTIGGKVTATMVFAGSSYAFDYAGTIVEGCHAVYENGAWKRVEDSQRARKIDRAVERWYNLNTTNHEIWVAGVRFGDDIEVDHDRPAKTEYWAENILARNELESSTKDHVIQQHMGRFHVG